MSEITNTSKNPKPEWLFGQRPGAIEAQEEIGQEELVASDCLPTECNCRAELESAGVVFGSPLPDDPLFCKATLPPGWGKKAKPGTQYWTDLLDVDGKVRGRIFYKAAFYDRHAVLYKP